MVEQVDRDAAEAVYPAFLASLKGEDGGHGLAEAFARHRIAAEARGMEKAADEIERLREALQMAVDWADRHDKEPSWLDAARAALKGNQ